MMNELTDSVIAFLRDRYLVEVSKAICTVHCGVEALTETLNQHLGSPDFQFNGDCIYASGQKFVCKLTSKSVQDNEQVIVFQRRSSIRLDLDYDSCFDIFETRELDTTLWPAIHSAS